MKKATINYWVDLATGAAFLLCAATGIVFLFPAAVHTTAGAAPTILLTPALWWHKVHDWSGVVMVAGTALHLALHARWIANMTRRTFAAKTGAVAARTAAYATPQAADAAAVASLHRLEHFKAERRREHELRISRRRFLAVAGAVGGITLLAGTGLIGRRVIGGTATTSSANSRTYAGQSSAGQSSSSSESAQVLVDESTCVACGRCLQTCPESVFSWSDSGRATAQDPGACIRCKRCLQVCPAGAITVAA
jgi:NAD-dependent dihydropyrimidine dehydrogenase PreA subunit